MELYFGSTLVAIEILFHSFVKSWMKLARITKLFLFVREIEGREMEEIKIRVTEQVNMKAHFYRDTWQSSTHLDNYFIIIETSKQQYSTDNLSSYVKTREILKYRSKRNKKHNNYTQSFSLQFLAAPEDRR